jgi:hypothetical protein
MGVAAEMDGAAEFDGVAELDGEAGREYDFLTPGEQVIFDVMFDIHHPNFIRDDNGVYRFRED